MFQDIIDECNVGMSRVLRLITCGAHAMLRWIHPDIEESEIHAFPEEYRTNWLHILALYDCGRAALVIGNLWHLQKDERVKAIPDQKPTSNWHIFYKNDALRGFL